MIAANINFIPMLNGTNFKNWKENIMIVLSCIDLDLTLKEERPTNLMDESSIEDKRNFEK